VTSGGPTDDRSVSPEPGSPESLARWKLTPEDLAEAESTGELALVSLARAFAGSGRAYDIDEVAELSGMDVGRLRALWRSLGFPEPRSGEKVFTDTDLRMLGGVIPLLADSGLEEDTALQVTRVIGSSMSRVANAQVDAVVGRFEGAAPNGELAAPLERTPEMAAIDQRMAAETAAILDAMPDVLEFAWRRHLVAAAERRLLRGGEGDEDLCVGFADLVGFTAHTQRLSQQELADVVERFEELSFEVVSRLGGRVVKMIGDEVLFVADDIVTGAHIALAVADAYREDEDLSDVRVGLAAGDVLERDGDVYGPVVNLANRIVAVAFPGSVVVSKEVAEALEGEDTMVLRSIRSQPLKDIGTVPLWTLRSAAGPGQPVRTLGARRHLREREQELLDRRQEIAREGIDDAPVSRRARGRRRRGQGPDR
jgi:adenylate cyclase